MNQLELSSMKKRVVKVPLYCVQIIVYYGNYDELNEINIQYGFGKLYEMTSGRALWNSEANKFTLFFRNDMKIKIGCIAHECKHMVNIIFRERGVELDIENDETECYLLEWLVDKIYSIIKN